MKLVINNFAKIKHADITVDGITVIAGENNTAKSTIGKVLYSSFNSLYDMDEKIEKNRAEEIFDVCYRSVRNTAIHSLRQTRAFANEISRELSDALARTANISEVIYRSMLVDTFKKYDVNLTEENIDELYENSYEKIVLLKKHDDYEIALELIQRLFLQVFDSQIQCLTETGKIADVALIIKNKELSMRFKNNECVSWKAEYNILHEAFLIDDPFVLDNLTGYYYAASSNVVRGQLVKHLRENNLMDGIFEAVSAKENLKEIYNILDKITRGKISIHNGQWGLNAEQYKEPVHFENLSAGLKSFVLIKMLLEKGILKERDVLILDEPEIHLHPEWQLVYAEIIVLLQEKFDLSIVVTTHSRDFLEAIELNVKKYNLESKSNYYLSDKDNDGLVTFENVTNDLDKIYRQLVTPSMLLDKLRYEIGMDENE